MTQSYAKDFRYNAIQLYLSQDQRIKTMAKDLGVSHSRLGKGMNDYKQRRDKSFPSSGHVPDKELQALKKDVLFLPEKIEKKKCLMTRLSINAARELKPSLSN